MEKYVTAKTLSERDLKHLDLAIERKEKMKSVVPLIEALIHLVVETLIEVGSNDENMSKLVFLLEKPTSMNLSDFHNKYIDEDNLYAVLSQAYSKDFLREIESSLRQRIKIFSDKMKPIVQNYITNLNRDIKFSSERKELIKLNFMDSSDLAEEIKAQFKQVVPIGDWLNTIEKCFRENIFPRINNISNELINTSDKYYNFFKCLVLIKTHDNEAYNKLLEKIKEKDINNGLHEAIEVLLNLHKTKKTSKIKLNFLKISKKPISESKKTVIPKQLILLFKGVEDHSQYKIYKNNIFAKFSDLQMAFMNSFNVHDKITHVNKDWIKSFDIQSLAKILDEFYLAYSHENIIELICYWFDSILIRDIPELKYLSEYKKCADLIKDFSDDKSSQLINELKDKMVFFRGEKKPGKKVKVNKVSFFNQKQVIKDSEDDGNTNSHNYRSPTN